MEQQLAGRLFQFITVNNPDLLFNLQADRHVSAYIRDKVKSVEGLIQQLRSTATPDYLIEEQCFALLTENLRPSKFPYIKNVQETAIEDQSAEPEPVNQRQLHPRKRLELPVGVKTAKVAR